jgi:hypothetical protein
MISNATILWIAAPGKKTSRACGNMLTSPWQCQACCPPQPGLRPQSCDNCEHWRLRHVHLTQPTTPSPSQPCFRLLPTVTATFSFCHHHNVTSPPTKPQSKPPYRVISDRWETVRLIREARPPAGIKEANKWAVSAHRFTLPNAFAL